MKYLLSSVFSFLFLIFITYILYNKFYKKSIKIFWYGWRDSNSRPSGPRPDALSQTELHPYNWWGEKESNLRRWDLQSHALPTELSPHKNKTEYKILFQTQILCKNIAVSVFN